MNRRPLGVLLGTLRSGERVFDRPISHARIHWDEPFEDALLKAIARIEANGREFVEEGIDFGTTIGETNCVETNDGDEIVYAKRKGRKSLSRYVRGREKKPTSFLSLILMKVPEGYILITAYFGPKAPPEPWDPHAPTESEPFWRTHALIWNEEEIVPGSGTTDESKYFTKSIP